MATIHLHQTTTATPGQFVAGLTDFGPGRKELFPNSADGYLKVHDQGPDWADVTEGSNGIWERLRYDWSNPGRITMTTTDSNTWGGHSGHTYTLTPRPGGSTDVDVVGPRGQEPQGPADRGPGGGRRQARPGQGAGQHHQGHRGPELPKDSGECLTWPSTPTCYRGPGRTSPVNGARETAPPGAGVPSYTGAPHVSVQPLSPRVT